MKKILAALTLVLLLAGSVALSVTTNVSPVQTSTAFYNFSILDPSQGLVKIDYTVEGIENETITFEFPYPELNTSPLSITFFDGRGNSLIPINASNSSWALDTPTSKTIRVSYALDLPKLHQPSGEGPFPMIYASLSSYLEEDWGLIEGSSFIYSKELLDNEFIIDFELPADWKIATALEEIDENRFKVNDFRELLSMYVLIGKFNTVYGGVGNIPIEVAVVSNVKDLDINPYLERTESAIEQYVEIFGGAPFEKYVLAIINLRGERHVHFGGFGKPGGALLICEPIWPIGPTSPAWNLIGHEIFHSWDGLGNGGALGPKEFDLFDFQSYFECPSIWFVEGFTVYYEELTSVKLGYCTETNFYQAIASSWGCYESSQTPFATGSFDPSVFLNKYCADLIAFLLDLKIRDLTDNERSLDDVMRAMYEEYGNKKEGYSPGAILETVNEVSGADFGEFFERYVYGHEEIGPEIDQVTKEVIGITITGVPSYRSRNGRVVVNQLPPHSSAVEAGLEKGDVVVGFDGEMRDADRTMTYLKSLKVGETCDILVERGDQIEEIEFTLEVFKEDPNPSQRALEIRKSLFGGL